MNDPSHKPASEAIALEFFHRDKDRVVVNVVFLDTGEIRQFNFTYRQLLRALFGKKWWMKTLEVFRPHVEKVRLYEETTKEPEGV